MNPLEEPKGGGGSPQSCSLHVFQRVGGVHVLQGRCVCRGLWGGPGGVWRCSLAASSPPPVQKPAPSAGPPTGPKPPLGSPGCRREHVTPEWVREMVINEQNKTGANLWLYLCVCVCVPAAPPAGRGSAVGGSDWSSPAVQLAGVGWGLGVCRAAHPAGRGTPPHRPAAAWRHPSHKPNAHTSVDLWIVDCK